MKRAFKFDNPRIIGYSENISLRPHMLFLIFVDHFVLFQFLDRNNVSCFLVTADTDLSKGATTYYFYRIKVEYSYFSSPKLKREW